MFLQNRNKSLEDLFKDVSLTAIVETLAPEACNFSVTTSSGLALCLSYLKAVSTLSGTVAFLL